MPTSEHMLLNGLLLLLVNALCTKCWSVQVDGVRQHGIDMLHATYASRGRGIMGSETTATSTTEMSTLESNNCLRMQCKFVCFYGQASSVATDIDRVVNSTTSKCDTIEELRLYNYEFANATIPRGFLQHYSDKVKYLYIACSNVTDVEAGAFGNGIYQQLYLEDLRLRELRSDFFGGITWHFETLTIVQKEHSVAVVNADFMDHVKYQITQLTLQVGLACVRNVTASGNLLNALVYADFRYNNFGDKFSQDTFSQLSMVEHLDLSHSQISYLPGYVFADVATRLEYLDLSYNQLTTISSSIFGWQTLSPSLKLSLHNNNWHCTCSLHNAMKLMSSYLTTKSILCMTPMRYHNWSVFDTQLCYNEPATTTISTASTITAGTLFTTTTTTSAPLCANCTDPGANTMQPFIPTSQTDKFTIRPNGNSTTTMTTPQCNSTSTATSTPPVNENVVEMVCLARPNEPAMNNSLAVQKPIVDFDIEADVEQAYVVMHAEHLNDSYGLLWFSNVTQQYYKMQINYNDYGLGCYGSISYRTIIENLEPGECYTICVVLKQQMKISPFNCKSIRTLTNLQTNEWITEEAVEKSIALLVFGIIGCLFIGILCVYLLLKQKPTLLKGSKRVATSRVNPDEIVVFPKEQTVASMKHKQEMLAKRCSRSTIACVQGRRGSDDSTASYQSYMNANLYEVIPSYLKFSNDNSYADLHGLCASSTAAHDYESPPPIPPPLPLSKPPSMSLPLVKDLVDYAEIPKRSKRTSDDPLPAVPSDQEPLSIALSDAPLPVGLRCSAEGDMISEV